MIVMLVAHDLPQMNAVRWGSWVPAAEVTEALIQGSPASAGCRNERKNQRKKDVLMFMGQSPMESNESMQENAGIHDFFGLVIVVMIP